MKIESSKTASSAKVINYRSDGRAEAVVLVEVNVIYLARAWLLRASVRQ